MFKSNFFISGFQVLGRFAGNILFFPLWWYSVGFVRFASRVLAFWREEQRALGVAVWIKNLFVPMYGQYDFAGRLISFFVRLVQIVLRSLALLFWVIIGLALVAAWLVLPLAIVLAIVFQLL